MIVRDFTSTVRISILFCDVIEVDSMLRSGLAKIALPYCSWGLSNISFIPAISNAVGPRCVSWTTKISHSVFLLRSDKTVSLSLESPSMLTEVVLNVYFDKSRSIMFSLKVVFRCGKDWPVINRFQGTIDCFLFILILL